MAEAVKINREERPVNFRQKSTISAENLERNFRHADEEINKIYQILGNDGIISQGSIQTVVIVSGGGGGGGGGGAPADAIFLMIGNDARFPKERALVSNQGIKQVDGGANGNLVLSADINALTEKADPDNLDFVMIYDATGLNNKKVTIDKLSEYWQNPVISQSLTTPPV